MSENTAPERGQFSDQPDRNIWPGVSYEDAPAARKWLASLGFQEGIVVPGEREGEIRHSEMIWPEGGRVMLHSRGTVPDAGWDPSHANTYVVCSDPDAIHDRAVALGAEIIRPLEDEETYESRGFSIRDAEGNNWSFGTYAG